MVGVNRQMVGLEVVGCRSESIRWRCSSVDGGGETVVEREEVKGARAASAGSSVESVASGDQCVDGRDESAGGG